MNEIDLAALALVLAFAYRGYRSGLIAVVLGLTGGLLAFGLAAVLAPLLAPVVTPFVTEEIHLPGFLVRPALVVALTLVMRFLLGFAVRELTAVLRTVVRGVPPLALADRVLGVLPAATLGALLAVALVLLALVLPRRLGLHDAASESWIARTVLEQPERTWERARARVDRVLTEPPRVNGYILVFGLAGLAVATVASGRVRGPSRPAAYREAPTRRAAPAAFAEAEAADPLAWFRAVLGVGVALTMAAGMFFLIAAR